MSKEQQAETRRQVEEIEGDAYHHHHDAGDENELFAQDQVRMTPTPTSVSVHVLSIHTKRFDKTRGIGIFCENDLGMFINRNRRLPDPQLNW